jgi:NAD-dependent deacetylase
MSERKRKLVVFSGAGMSAESGVSTFRDSGGLWEKHSIEEVATPQAFNQNPKKVLEFYNQRRRQSHPRSVLFWVQQSASWCRAS